MTQRIESSPRSENFVRYSEGPQHDSSVSYSALPDRAISTILSFAEQGIFSRIAHEWREENRPVLRRIIQQIRFEDAATQSKMAEVREELVASGETLVGAATAAHRTIDTCIHQILNSDESRLLVSSVLSTGRFPRIWDTAGNILQAWQKWREQTPEEESWDLHTLIFCREFNTPLQQMRVNLPENLDGVPEYEALLEQAHRFIAEGDLALRLHKAIQDRHLNPQARMEDVAATLNALHERQREYARALGQNNERAFHSAPPSDSYSYFLGLESEFRRRRLADSAQTLALQRLWHGPAQDFEQNPPIDANAIRNLLMNPLQANPTFTSTFHENLPVIPPEIGRCTALERISWSGPLLGLPEEMEALTHLTHLFLRNTNFSELPSVLERIPNLELLSIENNQQPIRKISERLWTNLMGRGFLHTVVSWLPAQKIRVIYNADLRQVRELPFEMWFLNHYTLPYIPSPMSSFLRIGHRDNRSFPAVILICLCATPFALLNLPILLVNLFIAVAIRPLVTAIRDELGYSRMIHLGNDER